MLFHSLKFFVRPASAAIKKSVAALSGREFLSERHRFWLAGIAILAVASSVIGQTPAKPSSPSTGKPGSQKQTATPPPAPKHYPILLIAAGIEPVWSVRIGMKGPERLDRAGYPAITLEPGAIEQETTGSAWLYHAKDTGTSADVALRLTREPCMDGPPTEKYSFRAVVSHAQIGELKGCAKIAAEQFPEFKQKNLDDEDPEKKKVVPPPITGFKAPVAVAFLDPTGKVMLARGETAKVVAPAGTQLSLAHDGKRLLYTREEADKGRTIVLYDAASGKSTDLMRGAQAAFWSPDDSRIAFLKLTGTDWQVWTMPVVAADRASQLSSGAVNSLQGWADVHTVIATNDKQIFFLRLESPPVIVGIKDVYGNGFDAKISDTIRANPSNPDLLLVTASVAHSKSGVASATFLYELKSGRQVTVTPATTLANDAEWSRDGIQIFFTDAAKAPAICRVFWDGSGFKRQRAGSGLVVGQ